MISPAVGRCSVIKDFHFLFQGSHSLRATTPITCKLKEPQDRMGRFLMTENLLVSGITTFNGFNSCNRILATVSLIPLHSCMVFHVCFHSFSFLFNAFLFIGMEQMALQMLLNLNSHYRSIRAILAKLQML